MPFGSLTLKGGSTVSISLALETRLDQLAAMQRIRSFEEEVARLRSAGTVVGSVHLCNGQEAIYVGAANALNLPTDLVFPTYRGHGWAIACGIPLEALFAELMGRETGVNGGRGGSAYLSAPDYGMMGENSIVGAGAPIAAGAALAAHFDDSDRVCLAAFGDGAVNQGAVHEAFNFAAVMKLPVVFLVENNHWSELTPITATTVSDKLFKRAAGYGMPGLRVDGNDPSLVEHTVREAVDRARNGHGPTVIEAMTERIVGHYIGDAQTYRTKTEIEKIKRDEPIVRLRNHLVRDGVPGQAIDERLAMVDAEVAAASARAAGAPAADPRTAKDHLYA